MSSGAGRKSDPESGSGDVADVKVQQEDYVETGKEIEESQSDPISKSQYTYESELIIDESQTVATEDSPDENESEDELALVVGSSGGRGNSATVCEGIRDVEQTEVHGAGSTNTIEYEDITDGENDPPKTSHFYGVSNVAAGNPVISEISDFSEQAYKKLPVYLLTKMLAPSCPDELARSFQEAEIFTIGDLSGCTELEVEAHSRIENPSHTSKFKMVRMALANGWSQFLEMEEIQNMESERRRKKEAGSDGEWFMPLDELSISLLRLPIDEATVLLKEAGRI